MNNSFQVFLYQIQPTGNDIVDTILGYDFMNIDGSAQNPMFWKNLINDNEDTYIKKYETEFTNILKELNQMQENFVLNKIDISNKFIGFSSSISLNTITYGVSIDIKESTLKIKENDLIEIMEDGEILFLGFVTNINTGLAYGDYYTQKLTILNVPKMFTLARVANNAVIADYTIKGLDLQTPDMAVHTDSYNDKNAFQIVDSIMTNLFAAKKNSNSLSEEIEYIFDDLKIKNIQTFNIIYMMLITLYMYNSQHNKQYTFCKIKNGQHKVYNEMVASSFPMWTPTYKNPEEILKDVINFAFYDVFTDYSGTINIRPPLYNYLPMNIFDFNESKFNKNSPFVITRKSIESYDFIYDNTAIETRTDAHFTFPYTGAYKNFSPQFFEDVNALVKFGFRNREPYNNPNAITSKGARIFAMLQNSQVNHASRNLTVGVKQDLSIKNFKYQLGRLYYIDLVDEKIVKGGAGIETINNSVSNCGVVGYLTNITKSYSNNTYILYKLTFTYVRNIEMVYLNNLDENSKSLFMDDMFHVYNKLDKDSFNEPGFQKFLSEQQTGDMTISTYNKNKTENLNSFKQQFQINVDGKTQYVEQIPMFKIMPTILDLIELTYNDHETKEAIKDIVLAQEPVTDTDSVIQEGDILKYIHYKFKLQRFFNYDNNLRTTFKDAIRNQFTYLNPQLAGETVASKEDMQNYNKFLTNYNKSNIKNVQNTINNYQHSTAFDKFYLCFNNNNVITSDNTRTWLCDTPFLSGTETNKKIGKIKQKLFNRICEMDIEMQQKYKMPITHSALKYIDDDGREQYWDGVLLGKSYTGGTNSNKWTDYIIDPVKSNAIFNTTNSGGVEHLLKSKLPKSIVAVFDPLTNKYVINDVLKGQHLQEAIYNVPIDNINTLVTPGFNFNLANILYYNTFMTVPDEAELEVLNNQNIKETNNLIKAHKNGLAIDFILPAQQNEAQKLGLPSLPWPFFSLGGEYSIKDEIYTDFENMLGRYFDKTVRTTTAVTVNYNELKGVEGNTYPTQKYAIYIYHIGVNDGIVGQFNSEVSTTVHEGIIQKK